MNAAVVIFVFAIGANGVGTSEPANECPVTPGPPFATALPGLNGIYGSTIGGSYPLWREVEVDLRRFLEIRRIWLEAFVWEEPPIVIFSGVRLNGWSPWYEFPCGPDNTCFEFGLFALLGRTATLRMEFEPPRCFDCGGVVVNAVLWIDGFSVDSAESLLGFAEFQTCIGLVDLAPEDCCLVFDDDGDNDVDLIDLRKLYR